MTCLPGAVLLAAYGVASFEAWLRVAAHVAG